MIQNVFSRHAINQYFCGGGGVTTSSDNFSTFDKLIVTEYVDQFDTLMHQILAHDPLFSVSSIANRFADGLKSVLKLLFSFTALWTWILAYCGNAVSLALLQEELLIALPGSDTRRLADFPSIKSNTCSVPTGSPSLSTSVFPGTQRVNQVDIHRRSKSGGTGSDERKAVALMAYRKAKGLCYKCGLRWGPQHKCGPTIPL
jgi:hypothetical protein